jgi:hypothetical protein
MAEDIKDAKDDAELIATALEEFKECYEAEDDNRQEALDDIRFARLGEQWPLNIRQQRQLEGKPCLTLNTLPSFIRQVVNDSRQNKPAIKVKPVDDNGDPETAEILSGLIRNIEYISNADVAYDTAVDNAVTCGVGYLRVDVDYAHDDTFDLDILIKRVANIFSVYGDPLSESADSSDWMRAFVVDRMDKNVFKRKYKGAEPVDWDELGYNGQHMQAPWLEQETIQVAEWWKREEVSRKIVQLTGGQVIDAKQYRESKEVFDALGLAVRGEREVKSWKVVQRIVTGAEILEENKWPGIYIPIIPVYGEEVNLEGKRYFRSMIRDVKDAMRMRNYWRTASTELVALSPRVPFIGPQGAFDTDARKWATINTQNHPYVQYDGPTPPTRQPLESGAAIGAMQEALAANDDIKSILGMFDASLGKQSNETSGRAILARQRESDTSTFHFIDNLSRAIRHLGRVVIDLVPHVYNGPRILRIVGEDGESKNVPVNQSIPTTVPGAQTGQEASQTQQALDQIYDLTTGRYDVVVETGPSYNTKREEAATQMVEMMRAYPQGAPLMVDLLAKNLDWPGADEIAERFKAMLPPQVQGVNPETQALQQQLMQLQQQAMQQISQLQQQNEQLQQDKMIDAKKLEIDAYNAETNRLKATSAGMTLEQVQVVVVDTLRQVLSSQPPNAIGIPDTTPIPAPPGSIMQPTNTQAPQGAFLLPADNQPNNGVMNG